MTGIILLFAVGTVLLFFEVLVPGGVLGVLAAILLIAGCVVAFAEFGSTGGLSAVVVAVVLVGATLYIELAILPKTSVGRRMFLRSSVSGKTHQAPARREEIVGKTGVAATTLAPSGFVVVDKRRYEAFSQSGLLPQGAAVTVMDVDNFRLIVAKS